VVRGVVVAQELALTRTTGRSHSEYTVSPDSYKQDVFCPNPDPDPNFQIIRIRILLFIFNTKSTTFYMKKFFSNKLSTKLIYGLKL
jgi:hypothetical protein